MWLSFIIPLTTHETSTYIDTKKNDIFKKKKIIFLQFSAIFVYMNIQRHLVFS